MLYLVTTLGINKV